DLCWVRLNGHASISGSCSSLCRRHEELLRIKWRAKPIAPAREIALRQRGGRHVLNIFEAGLTGQFQHLGWSKETDERRAACPRSLLRHLKSGTYLGVRQLQRKQECHGER